MFLTNVFSGQILPWCLYVSYQHHGAYIIKLFTQKLQEYVSPTLFIMSKNYHCVCTWVIRSAEFKFSCYGHRSYRGKIQQLLSQSKLPWCVCSYVIRFAVHKLTCCLHRDYQRNVSTIFSFRPKLPSSAKTNIELRKLRCTEIEMPIYIVAANFEH